MRISLAQKQKLFLFYVSVSDVDLIRRRLHHQFRRWIENYQPVEVVMHMHSFETAVIDQNYMHFFVTQQNVKGVERLNKKLYIDDRDEFTTVVEALVA